MTERPWLSTIIPSYNGDRWFADTLQSVADQSEPGIEVIVVDSSETTAALDIAESFAGKLRLRAYRRPDLASWMAKSNFGVAEAEAEWVSMLHKDDLWLPGRAAQIAGWLAAAPDAVMHLHPADIIDETGRRLGGWRCPLPTGPVPAPAMLERLLVQNFIAAPTPVIRRAAFLEVGGFDDELWHSADWDLYLKLLGMGEVHYHPQTLAAYRVHGASLGMTGSRSLDDFRRQMQLVLDRHIDRLAARREAVRRLAMVSVEVNVALAAASQGKPAPLFAALAKLAALGPAGIGRYLRHSRIIERAYPRLRARLAGGL